MGDDEDAAATFTSTALAARQFSCFAHLSSSTFRVSASGAVLAHSCKSILANIMSFEWTTSVATVTNITIQLLHDFVVVNDDAVKSESDIGNCFNFHNDNSKKQDLYCCCNIMNERMSKTVTATVFLCCGSTDATIYALSAACIS